MVSILVPKNRPRCRVVRRRAGFVGTVIAGRWVGIVGIQLVGGRVLMHEFTIATIGLELTVIQATIVVVVRRRG